MSRARLVVQSFAPEPLSVVAGRIEHMIETLAGPQAGGVDDLTARDLLALARAQKTAEDRAAAELLVTVARWADLHPPESIHDAAAFTVPGCEHEEPIAGDGAPLVAEFCLAELGTVLGISTTAAKKLVGHALELRHRLPRLWAQVQAGRVAAWRARLVAEVTIHSTPALTVDAAAFVDAQVAAVAGRVGPAQLDRLVAETIKRFDLDDVDPTQDAEDGYLHVDPRHATIHDDDVHFAGTMRLEAELDIADALDLDRALAHRAASLKALGSDKSLDARRSAALGDLARTQTALDLAGAPEPILSTCPRRAKWCSTRTSTRPPTGWPPCSVRPGAWRKASGSSCSTRSATGAPTPGPRSPSSRSSTSTPSSTPMPTRCLTGSGSRWFSATALACSRGAPARPAAATSTTSTSTTTTPTPRGDHNPARRRSRISQRCAASTTASRPTPPGATG